MVNIPYRGNVTDDVCMYIVIDKNIKKMAYRHVVSKVTLGGLD